LGVLELGGEGRGERERERERQKNKRKKMTGEFKRFINEECKKKCNLETC
jgi:hypothetical protein